AQTAHEQVELQECPFQSGSIQPESALAQRRLTTVVPILCAPDQPRSLRAVPENDRSSARCACYRKDRRHIPRSLSVHQRLQESKATSRILWCRCELPWATTSGL